MQNSAERAGEIAAALTLILGGAFALAGYLTHIIVCLQSHSYLLLVAGAIAFPVGVVHGIGAWFGAWS